MNKILLIVALIATNIFANVNDVIISENYIPQKYCKIIQEIKVDDNKTASRKDIYKQLKIKADKLGANVVLNTTYHNSIFTSYITGDAYICDIEMSPSLKSKKIEINKNRKFPLYMYENPMISSIFNNN